MLSCIYLKSLQSNREFLSALELFDVVIMVYTAIILLPTSISLRASVRKENKNGQTALDVARNWGDDFIYAILYAKAQTLPPVVKKGMYIVHCI